MTLESFQILPRDRFPNCKINLGLNIVRKRSDGFHDLETVFIPIPLHDVLEIIPTRSEHYENDIALTIAGINIEGEKEDNICVKAWRMLKNDFPSLPPAEIYVYKNIPAGAGLGGGSADGAFTLRLLAKLFDCKLSEEHLLQYATQLGSDCPFFLINKPCFASGRGEMLEEIEIDLGLYQFILVNPGIHVHTGNAFAQTTPSLPQLSIKEIIHQPITRWKETLKNDFEDSVFRQFPELKKTKDELYNAGAIYVSMTGSGSSLYGIFEKEKDVKLSFPPHYRIVKI
jgi:4-diphosphocytidyl-2-C-methyl-D-erythritol kinase